MKQHIVALPIQQDCYQQFMQLSDQFNAGTEQSLSKEAGKLMSDVSCQIIDSVFKVMVSQFLQVEDLSTAQHTHFKEALGHIEEVKGVMCKYTPWAVSWFGNERLAPVVRLYTELIKQGENGQVYLAFNLPQPSAERALLALQSLEHGKVDNAEGAVESLIEVTDIGVDALVRQPKNLLKFNFVADKTLNGVINMTTKVAYNNLRKLGQQLDPLLFKTVAAHLQQFIQSKAV